jgi:hypothetical protein
VQKDLHAAESILVGHMKQRNHLHFNLEEKKEVEETRVAMLAQELRAKYAEFDRAQLAERERQQEADEIKLRQMIAEAKAQTDTLREAKSASRDL